MLSSLAYQPQIEGEIMQGGDLLAQATHLQQTNDANKLCCMQSQQNLLPLVIDGRESRFPIFCF